MIDNKFMNILKQMMVLNYDNGKKFKITDRLDVICELLWDSDYRRINPQGLFHMYAKQPLDKIDNLVIVSTHVDCHKNIDNCYAEIIDDNTIKGTFDNGLTNAIMVNLMLENKLSDNIIIAFTGDEEEGSRGAKDVVKYMKNKGIDDYTVVILDVTDMGWDENADYTIENNFWEEKFNKKIQMIISQLNGKWLFVPSYVERIPADIPSENVIYQEAEADESWDYDEKDVRCFSFCIPTCGDMHSNEGIYARLKSCDVYMENLVRVLGLL